MNEVALAKDIVAVMDKHGLPPDMRLSFMIGLPVGVLKSQGATDDQAREFVQKSVDVALGAVSAVETAVAGKPVKR